MSLELSDHAEPKEQKDELHRMIAIGMPKKDILAVFYPETDVAKMREIRWTYWAVKNKATE